jgi:hypothetical protein
MGDFGYVKGAWLGAFLALVATANAWPAPRSGVYSNVCLYPETDDLGGVAIQITLDAPPAGVFWLCEGGCGWPEPMTSIRISGDKISFSVADTAVDAAGKIVQSTTYHYRGKFTARGLMLTSDLPDLGRAILTRRRGEKPVLARAPEAGRNEESTPYPVRRCR